MGKWEQCDSIYGLSRGMIVFCSRTKHHEGDHRGIRTQWDKDGFRVPITLPPDTK